MFGMGSWICMNVISCLIDTSLHHAYTLYVFLYANEIDKRLDSVDIGCDYDECIKVCTMFPPW